MSIDQVITGGETIYAFVKVLRPRGSALYDNLSVIPVTVVEEIAVRVKSYIELEIANEGKKQKGDPRGEKGGATPAQEPPRR